MARILRSIFNLIVFPSVYTSSGIQARNCNGIVYLRVESLSIRYGNGTRLDLETCSLESPDICYGIPVMKQLPIDASGFTVSGSSGAVAFRRWIDGCSVRWLKGNPVGSADRWLDTTPQFFCDLSNLVLALPAYPGSKKCIRSFPEGWVTRSLRDSSCSRFVLGVFFHLVDRSSTLQVDYPITCALAIWYSELEGCRANPLRAALMGLRSVPIGRYLRAWEARSLVKNLCSLIVYTRKS